MMRHLTFLLSFLCVVVPAPAQESSKLDPKTPLQGKKSDAVTYEIDFSAVVTAPYHTKTLRIWLPIAQPDAAQTIEGSELSAFPMKVTPKVSTESVHGNKFAYFEFDHPEGAQIVRHKFKATIHEMRWNIEPAKVVKVQDWPKAFVPYLKSDQSIVVNEKLRGVLADIGLERKNPSDDLAGVMKWVNLNIKYDHFQASLKGSSESALTKKAGHCSDYHGLCAAFGRALGYPTRVTYGLNPFPKNSPSHCKLEAYLPPYGWVVFDVSETQRVIEAIQKDKSLDAGKKEELTRLANERLQRGFRDNTWLQMTRGTDYDLVPPAKHRVPVVRTIYAEADGVPLIDPDPANPQQREFGWMTVHRYTPSRPVEYPFKGWKNLVK